MYKIAYFAVDWNYELVDQTLHGLKEYVDAHRNVVLRIFDCFGKDLDNDKDKSEYRIFSLPDLSTFDGAILLGNQLILQRVRDELVKKIDAAGIPAVSIGCPLPGCVLVDHDNRAAQKAMASHVIREHNARRLVYLTGNLANNCPEGRLRLEGFLDACRENGIPTENVQVLEKTWRTTDGADVARQWIEEDFPLPDAFICANDEMAMGLLATLQENKIRVPEDVIVTGYDNLDSAQLSCPRLSSVFCDYRLLNYRAMETLIDMIDEKHVPSVVNGSYEIITSESCGCPETSQAAVLRDRVFRQTRFLRSFYLLQGQLAEELFEANNLKDLTAAVLRNRAIFGCHDIFLCINDYYFDNYEKAEWAHDSESYG
ncbi:MAG: LacI family DNA-binding transcriptional regulator, partial [Lachnospiraceae bacterium]